MAESSLAAVTFSGILERFARFADIKKGLGTRVGADPLILVADSSGKPIASAGGVIGVIGRSQKKGEGLEWALTGWPTSERMVAVRSTAWPAGFSASRS